MSDARWDIDDPVTLAECPIGLFFSEAGTLCLKTEYGNNEGRIDAYIISSGEFFWGPSPQTIANQRKQMVRPAIPPSPGSQSTAATNDQPVTNADLARRLDGFVGFARDLIYQITLRENATREYLLERLDHWTGSKP